MSALSGKESTSVKSFLGDPHISDQTYLKYIFLHYIKDFNFYWPSNLRHNRDIPKFIRNANYLFFFFILCQFPLPFLLRCCRFLHFPVFHLFFFDFLFLHFLFFDFPFDFFLFLFPRLFLFLLSFHCSLISIFFNFILTTWWSFLASLVSGSLGQM